MALDLIFNELSSYTPARDGELGRRWMEQFVATLRKCIAVGIPGVLRLPKKFSQVLLAPGYPIGRWAGDANVSLDHRQFFKVVATKAPYLEELIKDSLKNAYELAEFTCGGEGALGLAIAFLLDSLAVSFISDGLWEQSNIPLRVVSLDEATTELLDNSVTVRNASTPKHLDEHGEWIAKRRVQDIRDGRDLWERRQTLFPALEFCIELEAQLKHLSAHDPCFRFAVYGFFRLQDFCTNWTKPTFESSWIGDCSIESRSTMEQYSAQRTFTDIEGNKRVFEWHLKKYNLRMYFIPIISTKRVLIGYVGRHLRTAKFQ